MKAFQTTSFAIARFLLSAIFLASSVNKIFHWHNAEQLLMDVLSDWQSHLSFSEAAQTVFSSLVLFTPVLLIIDTLFELFGGLLLLLGIKEKFGAAVLAIALVPTTIFFHAFWFVEGSARELQQIMFLKNLAILGGLILVLLHGAQSEKKKEGGGGYKLP